MAEIDWNLPLETDEATPRAAEAVRLQDNPPRYSVLTGTYRITYDSAGRPVPPCAPFTPRIRNVRPVRTADEALQRMEALVRRLAERAAMSEDIEFNDYVLGAREIVALLPEPVDPDVAEAEKIWSGYVIGDNYADWVSAPIAQATLAGIKRGRELAARGE